MKEKLKWLSPAILVVALVTVACCLIGYESEYLWKAQELNLFLDTPLFLKQQMVTSGWLLMWLGAYFTEFFYHPSVGVVLLCLWWALLMFVAGRTFRIPLKWAVVLFIPVAALLLTDVTLGYWVYYVKLHGYFFAATIGTTIAVASVWLYRLVPAAYYLRPVYMLVATAVLYPLIGFYGLLATALMGILSWRLDDMKLNGRVIASVVALLSIVFWPLFYYNFVFYQTSMQNIWWTGLPIFVLDKEYSEYYIPYYILGASLVAMALWYKRQRETSVRKPLVWGIAQLAIVAVLGYGIQHFWYRDANFHKELRMLRCIDNLDWEGVRAEAAVDDDEPTRAIVMMRNLALFRLGRQGNTMYHYKNGSKPYASPLPVNLAQVAGLSLYHHYGQYNVCCRWCMEYAVELGWKAEYLKYLTRCALISGEKHLAHKYLGLLKHTRYHKEWAERCEPLLAQELTLRKDPEFRPIFHLATGADVMNSGKMAAETFLMQQFLQGSSPDSLYQEQAVYAALWSKNIQTFWPRFMRYAQSHVGQPMPVHLQEAACLYGHLEHQVDISQMPFDKEVLETYDAFMKEANQYATMGEDQLARMLYPRYGKTFYYEYYCVRNLKTN